MTGHSKNKKGERGDCRRAATTRDMTKIVVCLGEIGEGVVRYIFKFTSVVYPKIRDALIFLEKYGIVSSKDGKHNDKVYFLSINLGCD